MKKATKTYMFTLSLTLSCCPTVTEEVGVTQTEALTKAVLNYKEYFQKLSDKELLALIKQELGYGDVKIETKIHNAGRANQYHSPKECKLCTKWDDKVTKE